MWVILTDALIAVYYLYANQPTIHLLYTGLRRDDTLRSNPIVEEAIRRLPENEYNDRVFRIKRALDLSLKHAILPKDQWTKFEEVCPPQGFTLIFEDNLFIIIIVNYISIAKYTKYVSMRSTLYYERKKKKKKRRTKLLY